MKGGVLSLYLVLGDRAETTRGEVTGIETWVQGVEIQILPLRAS